MAHNFALVDQTSDVVGVVIPNCPGCYAAGHTLEEAIGNIAEALDEWLADRLGDGYAAPTPRSVAELRADPSLAEHFADGSIVTLVPAGMADIRPSPGFDRALMAKVSAAAMRNGISVAAFLAAAARDKLAHDR